MRCLPKAIISIILILVISLGILTPPRQAYAILGIKDIVQDFIAEFGIIIDAAVNAVAMYNITKADLKEYILDPLAYIAVQTVIRAMTNQIIGWIQGEDAGFIKNLEQEFRKSADAAGGEFLNNLTGLNLCGNFGAFLNITLRTPGLRQRLECTVSDIVRNVENFYANFKQGGWPAFVRISLEPQNTAAGAYLIAYDLKLEAENRARERVARDDARGFGFKGFQVPVKKKCFGTSQSGSQAVGGSGNEQNLDRAGAPQTRNRGLAAIGSQQLAEVSNNQFDAPGTTPGAITDLPTIRDANEFGNEQGSGAEASQDRGELGTGSAGGRETHCTTEYETKTPGKLISDTLSKSVLSGYDIGFAADEINEGIAAIVNALITKMISVSAGGGGGAIEDSSFAELPIPTQSQFGLSTNSFFTDKTDEPILNTQISQKNFGDIIANIERQLFPIKLRILQLEHACQAMPLECNQAEINQLNSQKAPLEADKADAVQKLQNADQTLASLLRFRTQLTETTDPQTIQRLNQELTGLLINSQIAAQNLQAAGPSFAVTFPTGRGASSDPTENVISMASKAGQHGASAIFLIEEKLALLATSTATTTATIEMQSIRNVLTQKKGEVQQALDSLTAVRLQLLTARNTQSATLPQIISQTIAKIIDLNQKVTDVYKL